MTHSILDNYVGGQMKVITIRKGSKRRTIYAPDKAIKVMCRSVLRTQLAGWSDAASPPGVSHGFVSSRSPVTNAMRHIGFEYTVSFDLADFFDSVTEWHLRHVPPGRLETITRLCLVSGSPRQGLPTSPAVANIAASVMDRAILSWLAVSKISKCAYTRYADDLAFSVDNQSHANGILWEVPYVIMSCGFTVNPRKTTMQWSRTGRRIITGVAVDGSRAYATRKTKRRLRAARHNNRHHSARGLLEWCKLKVPAGYSPAPVQNGATARPAGARKVSCTDY